MNRIEKDTSAEETWAARDVRTGAMIDSLTQLESYYQSKYEYYLAMATEAKENKERVGLLLLDLDRDVSYPDNLVESNSIDRERRERSLNHEKIIQQRDWVYGENFSTPALKNYPKQSRPYPILL